MICFCLEVEKSFDMFQISFPLNLFSTLLQTSRENIFFILIKQLDGQPTSQYYISQNDEVTTLPVLLHNANKLPRVSYPQFLHLGRDIWI